MQESCLPKWLRTQRRNIIVIGLGDNEVVEEQAPMNHAIKEEKKTEN